MPTKFWFIAILVVICILLLLARGRVSTRGMVASVGREWDMVIAYTTNVLTRVHLRPYHHLSRFKAFIGLDSSPS